MAEIYPLGQNRIFYRPSGFTTGLIVEVEIIDPDLQVAESIELTELVGKGLYYFDYAFVLEGTYIGIFYEDGDRTTSQAFSTRNLPASLGSNISLGGYKGPNVL